MDITKKDYVFEDALYILFYLMVLKKRSLRFFESLLRFKNYNYEVLA